MRDLRRYVATTIALLAAAAAIAAAAVFLLPVTWVRWIPAVVGAAWTVALVWLVPRLTGEPGAPRAASIRSGVVACGLLTALAASWAVRDRVGWPELLLVAAALVAFGFWTRAMARELKRRRAYPPVPPGPVLGLGDPERDRPPPPRLDWPRRPTRPTPWM